MARPTIAFASPAYTPGTEFINQYKVETASYDAHRRPLFRRIRQRLAEERHQPVSWRSLRQLSEPDIERQLLAPRTDRVCQGGLAARRWGCRRTNLAGSHLLFRRMPEHSRAATPNVQTLTVPSVAERSTETLLSCMRSIPRTRQEPPTFISSTIRSPGPSGRVPASPCTVRNPIASATSSPTSIPLLLRLLCPPYPMPHPRELCGRRQLILLRGRAGLLLRLRHAHRRHADQEADAVRPLRRQPSPAAGQERLLLPGNRNHADLPEQGRGAGIHLCDYALNRDGHARDLYALLQPECGHFAGQTERGLHRHAWLPGQRTCPMRRTPSRASTDRLPLSSNSDNGDLPEIA